MRHEHPIARHAAPERTRLVGEVGLATPAPGALSARRKLAVILAASLSLWGGIGLIARAVIG